MKEKNKIEENENIDNSETIENKQTDIHDGKHSDYPLDHREPTWVFRSHDIIYYILGVLEVLLLFRLVFRSLGANPSNVLVAALYDITYALILPFIGIFKAIIPGGTAAYVIEPATIIAMVVYALIAYGVVKLAKVVA